MRYYIVAGERSGDMYGGNLIQALKQEDPQAEFRCWGGNCMQRAGGNLVVHYRSLVSMGLAFVFNILKLYKYLQFCKKDILHFRPHVIILIDYAGFNLQLAAFAKKHHIKTFYYTPPKLWAWHLSRMQKVRAYVDKVFSIFPFEQDFYRQYDYSVDYVGNPLVEQVKLHKANPNFLVANKLDTRPMIALLPGSRIQEVKQILPVMLSVVDTLSMYQFVVAAIEDIPAELYEEANRKKGVHVIYDQTYDVLTYAHAAVVASGTATLEIALFCIPQVVVYKTDRITYMLARWLVKLPYISLVNILVGERIVCELVQYGYNTAALLKALRSIIADSHYREAQLAAYNQIRQMLGDHHTSREIARLMIKYLHVNS